MSKKNLSKKELKKPDLFARTTGQIWKKVEQNLLIVKIGIIALALFGCGVTGFNYYQNSLKIKGQEAYFKIEKSLVKKKESFLKAKANLEKKDKKKKTSNNAVALASGDLQKDYGSELSQLEDLINEHTQTVASQLAAINMIGLYSEYDQAKEGIGKVPLFEKQKSDKNLFSGLLTIQIGNLLAQGLQCGKAVTQWQEVLKQKRWEFLHSQVRLKMGICYESLKQFEKAKEQFQIVKDKKATSSLSKIADKYLRTLSL